MEDLRSIKTGLIRFLSGALVLLGVLGACATDSKQRGPGVYPELGRPEDPIPFMENVRTGVLPGGLRYFILENPRPQNRAYLTLAVDAGSVLEEEDERGLAHFVEHMAFNGTARFPKSELVDYLRSLGMRFGPEVNAYTSYDSTVYGIEVPVELDSAAGDGAPVKRIPARALEVLDDWTRAITFDPGDVDGERLVIMEEYRSRLGALNRVQRQILSFLFDGSPYAERIPIGLPEIIETAPAERLEAFYRRWYRPDNMALIIVGDFDAAVLEAELPRRFPEMPVSGPLNRPRYDLSAPKRGTEAMVVTDPELSFTQVGLYYKRSPRPLPATLEGYREELMDSLIQEILGIRFEEASQRPDSPFIGAGAWNIRYGASSRYYTLMAESKLGGAEASLAALLREKESVGRFGFTPGEIDTAKASLLSELAQTAAEKDRLQSDRFVSRLTGYFLEGAPLPDIDWAYNAALKFLPDISGEDLAEQVKDYFAGGDLRVFIAAPDSERASLPDSRRIKTLVRQSLRLKLDPPAEEMDSGDLVSRIPKKGSILFESVDDETGARIWRLENGAALILKETPNRNNEVVLYAMARGGTSSAGAEERVSVSLAAEIAGASGLGPWSRTQLIRLLAGKQVNLSFWAGNYLRGFQGSAASGDLETLFKMLYLSFTDPRVDRGILDSLLDSYRTNLAQRGEDPNAVFSDLVGRMVSGGHPHFEPLTVEDMDRVDADQVMSFLNRSLNPGDYTFILTGNLDPAQTRSMAETWLASIPPREPWNAWTDLDIRRPGKTEERVYKGKEEQSMVYMGWYAPLAFSEEQSVRAGLLEEYLNILLVRDIREKLGGVYSISAGLSLSPAPKGELMMQIFFACDPRRSGELSAEVEALLERILREPLDEDTFAKSVEALKKEWEASVQSNLYIAQSYANSTVLMDTPLSRLDKRPGLYDQASPAELQALCRLLLPRGPAKAVLYPEGWTGP
ncbi:MAG: insulinase family protein [Treponema sp.]|jgi:zinc protease|nr:insulinase family protein [Treponema sp.]